MNSFSTPATTTAIPNSAFNNINIAGKLIAASYLTIIKLPINDSEYCINVIFSTANYHVPGVICGSELPHLKLLLLCIQTYLSGVLVITAFMSCVTLQLHRFYANYYNNTTTY